MATIVRQHIERMGNEIINQREARITEGGEKDSNQDPTCVKVLLIPPMASCIYLVTVIRPDMTRL
jgi:hypothetical protein